MATPDMGLDLPVPGVTTGPTWANKLNTALTTIDAHDHSSGKGAPVHIEDIAGAGTMAQQNAASVAITGGNVAVSADPTTDLQVATKHYVDQAAGDAITQLSGDVQAVGPGAVSAILVNVPFDVAASQLKVTPVGAPATPPSGKARMYVDSTSKALAVKTDSGVVSHTVQTKSSVSHQFLTAIDDDGTVHSAQPTAADLTGLAAIATSGSASDLIAGTVPQARTAALTGDVTKSAGSSTTTLANIPNDVPMVGDLLATTMAAPAAPVSGKARIYVDATAKTLSVINSDGNISHTVFSQTPATSRYVVGIDDNGVIETGSVSVTDVSGATATGQALMSAASAAAARTTLGLGSLATQSSITASQISDSTTAGRAMLTAATAVAQAELLAPSIASWGRGLVHNTSVPPSGSWTPDSYVATTGVVSFETGGQYQIHGLTGGVDGRIVVIYCATGSGMGLVHEDGAATAADRFYSPTSSVGAGQAVVLRYSGALSRWVTICAPAIYPSANVPNIGEVQFNYFGSALAASPGIYGSTLVWLDSYDTLQVGAVQLAARIQQKLGSSTASAGDLTLPGHDTGHGGATASSGGGNTYPISGSTTINRLSADGWQSGSRVRLIFGAATTVTHHGASASAPLYPFDLSGGVDFLTGAGDQLDLVFDGSYWQEAGRRAA